jgi:hypothetical protein
VSRDVVIKRPTTEERRTIARALGDSAVRQASAAAAAEKSLAQRTDEAARAQSRQGSNGAKGGESSASSDAAPRQKAMTFENAEKARGLAQEQRAMADRVQKLRNATQQLQDQLKAAGALDTSLARQLTEAQALLRQALTPELMAQMQKLENAAKQLNGDQSRDALRDLAQMQQRMKEQLERSAEMLKRAAHEGAMQTLADQAKELAQRERALGDSSAAAKPNTDSGSESAKLADQAKRLREQMEQLHDRLAKDNADAGAASTGEAAEHAGKSEAGMRRAANEQRGGERSGDDKATPGRQQQNAAGEMDRAANAMQQARAQQVKEWKKELTSELDRRCRR